MRPCVSLLVVTVAAMVGAIGVADAAHADTEIDLDASLRHGSAYTNATGFSEYERSATQRDVGVTVNHAHRLAGKDVKIYVNGTWVGKMHLNATGYAHREWDTEHGQSVPFASAGDPVRVRTTTGTLVVSGFYHPEQHT